MKESSYKSPALDEDGDIYVEDDRLTNLIARGDLRPWVTWGPEGHTLLALAVNCSDLFGWAWGGDVEPLRSQRDLFELSQAIEKDSKWGLDKWACRLRNLQPQHAVIVMMKADDVWDDDMEKLPRNPENTEFE